MVKNVFLNSTVVYIVFIKKSDYRYFFYERFLKPKVRKIQNREKQLTAFIVFHYELRFHNLNSFQNHRVKSDNKRQYCF